ncbi:hypothetical protein D1AOALGA4SA_7451 [Olavius algarvensis Delta 1 endosymbiont]|nr:hypothetical protein D1AOALGA4SA_7451 [Olavius algarvensis Delta 1 endosymbiont]
MVVRYWFEENQIDFFVTNDTSEEPYSQPFLKTNPPEAG